MNSEQVIKWVGRLLVLGLAVGIVILVFRFDFESSGWARVRKPAPKESLAQTFEKKVASGSEVVMLKPLDYAEGSGAAEIKEILAAAARKRGGVVVGILHCHVPGNPESEEIADSLNVVSQKYGNQVQVIRVDILAYPQVAKAEQVSKPPKVVMLVEEDRVFSFQGLWPYASIERKVDELLRQLRRMGRGWRPAVKGMQKAGEETAPTGPQPDKR